MNLIYTMVGVTTLILLLCSIVIMITFNPFINLLFLILFTIVDSITITLLFKNPSLFIMGIIIGLDSILFLVIVFIRTIGLSIINKSFKERENL